MGMGMDGGVFEARTRSDDDDDGGEGDERGGWGCRAGLVSPGRRSRRSRRRRWWEEEEGRDLGGWSAFVEEECGSGCWCCRGEAREGMLVGGWNAVLGGLVGRGGFLVSCVEVGGEMGRGRVWKMFEEGGHM